MKEYLNLLPAEAEKRRLPARAVYAGAAVALYIVFMAGFGVYNQIQTRKIEKNLEALRNQKQMLGMELNSLQAQFPGEAVPGEIFIAKAKLPWAEFLRELSLIVPKDVWLSSIESTEEKATGMKAMTFKGVTTNHAGVADFISALESSKFFYGLEILYSQKGDRGVSFGVKARMRWS
ncbi:MAG: PilN domain-containing protein [Nitrospirae bacterium]|nr:PilN domain-containing protein [Nitrospirota bacterium]